MAAVEFWDGAMDLDGYLGQMTQHHDLFIKRIFEAEISDADRNSFGVEPLRFLALTEDFCTDSAQFIPPIAKLAQELPHVELRFLRRDEHRGLANNYRRRDGYQAIPVIIALDERGNELGFLIERPRRVYDELAAETRRFAKEHPELDGINRTYDRMPHNTKLAVRENSERFRDENQERWSRWLLDELAEIVSTGIERRERQGAMV